MCGIWGKVGTGNINASDIEMRQLLYHRGPDSADVYRDDMTVLGHTRLSIIDLSSGGSQPKTDVTGRFTITFNGEIYNFIGLKKQFNTYPYRSNSDTEVILAIYSKYGYETPKYLKGQFAFCIWDNKEKELFFARDRMGEKPFYYSIINDTMYFSSELRTLIQYSGITPTFHKNSLAEYLRFQSVHAPNTLIENVKSLPASYSGVYKNGQISMFPYWNITDVEPVQDQEDSTVLKNIRDKLYDAVSLQMISDVSLGAFLSGGIDSSAIVGIMAEISDSPIKTFNVSFDEQKWDESIYAKAIAKKFNTDHHEIKLSVKDFVKKIPRIMESIDNPSADGPNTYIVSEAVRKAGLTVALSGLGGDELFAGYSGFKRFLDLNRYKKYWSLTYPIRKTAGYVTSGKIKDLLNLPELSLNNIYALNREVLSKDAISQILNNNGKLEFLSFDDYHMDHLPLVSQYSIIELSRYTRDVLLKDTDNMAMANSLEVRVPFFDYELISYVLALPDSMKMQSYPKSLLVNTVGFLPDEIVHRPKMGFTLPWDHWMRNELKPMCQSALEGLSKLDGFDEKGVINLWRGFERKEIYWSKVWAVVSLYKWWENIRK
jgi:asparagine synthase (glutamine-hydrolysing)